ncbi:teichoic acid biosynthesis protein B [Lactococcus lactis subsp. lactis IO-1]|nr:teichoic acid biosynthesis protein B [Lactococcus lactis subsp. lactis IO-1]
MSIHQILLLQSNKFHVLNLVNLISHSQKFTDKFSVSKFIHRKNH